MEASFFCVAAHPEQSEVADRALCLLLDLSRHRILYGLPCKHACRVHVTTLARVQVQACVVRRTDFDETTKNRRASAVLALDHHQALQLPSRLIAGLCW